MFRRLFGYFGLLVLASVGILGAVLTSRVEQQYRDQIDVTLHTRCLLIRDIVRDWPPDRLALLQERMKALGRPNQVATRITLLNDTEDVLADSEFDGDPALLGTRADRPEIQEARADGWGSSTRSSATVHKELRYVALRLDPSESTLVRYVRVALPTEDIQQHIASLRQIIWTAAAITALAALLLALWLARRITSPLQELRAGAERIAAGNYSNKVYLTGRDEIGVLAQTFNYMSERLRDQFNQLAADREQLRTILTGMVEGVVALDADQRILFVNDRAAELLSFRSAKTVGRRLWEVAWHRGLQDIVKKALHEPGPARGELQWDGFAPRNLTVHAVCLAGSPVRGAVLVLHDTTELRRLERLRQEFVANVSHELKTPLSVIKACVETLLDGAAEDAVNRTQFLERVAEQSDRLHALILDLLSLARIESGTEAFEFQAVPLAPLVTHCLERNRARAEANQQELLSEPALPAPADAALATATATASSPPSSTPARDGNAAVAASDLAAWADEEAVSQILDNLVDNALKYTPAGGRIWVRWRGENGQVCLEVEDTGIGIPEQDLPRIFERFYRVDKARSRELGGTGLGLSIVKHLVQAMQGTVQATSQVGRGTRFEVRLQRAPAAGS
jgi:two-component system phosphate regulon sensor histidine kinase PhoR